MMPVVNQPEPSVAASAGRVRRIAEDSLVYGLGGVIARGVSFLLLPIYTRIFTPAEYGAIEMVVIVANLLATLLVMGMDSAQSFFFFEQRSQGPQAQARVVSAILQWRLTWGAVMVVLATALSPLLNRWLFDGELSWVYFLVSFSGALLVTVMSQGMDVFRLLYRPWPYIGLMLAHALVGASAILTLVVGFDLGVFGFILGSALASLVIAASGWYLLRPYLDFSGWHTHWWPRIVRFGAPLVPGGLAVYALSSADRWFVQHYHGEVALGLYAVGAKFVQIAAVAVDPFRKAWWPVAMDAMQDVDGPETCRIIARVYMGLATAGALYLTFLAPFLIRRMTGSEFHAAHPIVGVLVWQAVFYGFSLIVSVGLWKVEKTHVAALLMGIAAAINIALNAWWVPRWGGMGAAFATALSYLLWVVMLWIVSERYWRVGFPVVTIAAQAALALGAGALIMFGDPGVIVAALVVHAVVAVLIFSALSGEGWRRLRRSFDRAARP